ncbi:MAG: ABC transporter permease [Rickettsia endosymbiont of Bryobia graminum]|nr:ABC transporter permease [Rickettsia endosymbiont of Bryobia graminum]
MIKEETFPFNEWGRWAHLGWFDILSRYRRTIFGPCWIVLLTVINISVIGFVYGTLFKVPLHNFIPYMAIGLITWLWISTSIIEASSAFVSYKFVLLNQEIRPTSILIRVLFRNLIIFFHNCVVILLICLFFHLPLSPALFFVLPGMFLATNIIYVLSIPIAFICTRFRDLSQVIVIFINLGFLITPVIWFPHILVEREYIVYLNPFTHIINLIRLPILGSIPPISSWLVSLGVFLLFSLFSFFCIKKYRYHIQFWL